MVLAGLAGGCVAVDPVGQAAGPIPGGELRVAVADLPATVDPQLAPGPHLLHRLLFETLLTWGPLAPAGTVASGLALRPHLAAGWMVSPDGRTVDLLLRQAVSFHDGAPLDAAAVRANLERVLALPEGTPARELLADVTAVEATGAHRLRLHLRRANPAIWNALASPLLGMMSPGSWERESWVGTGPYVFGAWEENAVTLYRNEAYAWPPAFYGNDGRAYPQAVTLAVGGDAPAHLWLDGAPEGEGLEFFPVAGRGLLYLAFNLRQGVAAEAAVRRAVAYAVDRAALAAAAEAVEPGWVPAVSPLAPGIWGFDPVVAGAFTPRQSPAAAREILALDGWQHEGEEDGCLVRDGVVLELEVLIQDRPGAVAMAAVLAEQLAAVGMRLRLRVLGPRDALVQASFGRFELLLAGYRWAPDPDVLHYYFHSSRVGTTNRGGYRSSEADRLLDAGRTEMDLELRSLVYSRIQRLLLSDLPWIPLLAEARTVGWDPEGLRGVLLGPAGEIWLHDAWLPGDRH